MTDAENTEFDAGIVRLKALDERIGELEEIETREAAAAAHRVELGLIPAGDGVTHEPEMYVKGGRDSFFRDLFNSTLSRDTGASERLRRHAVYAQEARAVGNTNAAGGSGGEWAPPSWLTDEWINLIRPSRVTADLFKHEDIPTGISSLNYPKLLTGTSVGLQTTQNTALPSTDPTTGFVQTGFATIGGKNVISQQLIDQGRNFDQVIAADLAAAYAQQVGTQVFTGTGTGTGTNAVINGLGAATIGSTQTWTQVTRHPGRVLRADRLAPVRVPHEAAHAPDVLGHGPSPLVLDRILGGLDRAPARGAQRSGVQPAGHREQRRPDGSGWHHARAPRHPRPAGPDQPRRRHQPGHRLPAEDR